MILQSLVKLYEALSEKGEIVGRGWCRAKVTHRIILDDSGNLIGLISVRVLQQRGKKEIEVPAVFTVPQQKKRASDISPNFLCDTVTYLLGIDNKGKPKRAASCFESSKQLHHAVLDGSDSLMAKAVLAFFDRWNPEKAKDNPIIQANWEDILSAGNMIFHLHDKDMQEDDSIKTAWMQYQSAHEINDQTVREQCLVTGKMDQPIAVLHPNIKGVQGAQSSGASLVSFNAPAYESYENDGAKGLNAPVSEYAAFAYGTALNHLLADRDHVQSVGDTTVVYWSEHAEPQCQNLIEAALNGSGGKIDDDTLKNVLHHMEAGIPADLNGIKIDPGEPFYVLGLAPNAARLSVRFFLQSTFGDVIQHLSKHQKRLQIVKPPWEKLSMIPLWRLLKQTANPHSKDKASSPLLAGAVFRSILTNSRYPEALLQNFMIRIFSDQDEYNEKGTRVADKIGFIRAAGIKACLLQNYKTRWEDEITMGINENCKEISYILGRLFSVLENIQKKANPGINTTIKDRYFNSACATPASVFPVLLKLANAHLGKLGEGSQVFFNKKIGELLSHVSMPDQGTPLPNHLNLEEQGAFVLGYYQETQVWYTKKGEESND